MGAASKPILTILERIGLITKLFTLVPLKLFFYLTRHVWIARSRGLPWKSYLPCASIKTVLGTLTPRQLQALIPPTRTVYESWIKRKAKTHPTHLRQGRLIYDVQELPSGNSSIMWIGNRQKASKFVLFMHGGGYVSPILPGHLEWCWEAYVMAGLQEKTDVAVAVLQYELAPGARYPMQLRQATDALRLIMKSGVSSGDIVIGGDSAGGNLTLQILQHALHPHPQIEPLDLQEPFGGAFLVSPWVSSDSAGGSFLENRTHDMLTPSIIENCREAVLGRNWFLAKNKKWALPGDFDLKWTADLSQVVKCLYLSYGSQEIFRDQCACLSQSLKSNVGSLPFEAVMSPVEAHDFILVEGMQGRVGVATRNMKIWFQANVL